MDNSYIDNINLDLDDLFAMNYDLFGDNKNEDKLEMSEQIIRGIEDVIVNILPINDEYKVHNDKYNEFEEDIKLRQDRGNKILTQNYEDILKKELFKNVKNNE